MLLFVCQRLNDLLDILCCFCMNLLAQNGPNSFMEATKISADPPNIQASASHYELRPSQVPNSDKGPPNVQDPKHIEKNDTPTSFYEHSSRSSPHPKNFDYSNTSANNSMSSGTYPPNPKPHGSENQGMEFRTSYPENESAFSSTRQHWNMEFKDATAAAQAAAESAERASGAARAAAELSSRGAISQQYSTESHMTSPHGVRHEEQRKYTGTGSQNEHLTQHPVNISLYGRNSKNYEQTDSNKQHNRAGEAENVYVNIAQSGDKSTHGSFKSTVASFKGKPSVNNQTADSYSQKNSFEGRRVEHFAEVSMKRDSGENGMQFENEQHDIKNPQNVDHHVVRVGEQSRYSSLSQSNAFTDDQDVVSDSDLNWQKSENDKRNSSESRLQFVKELHDTKNSDFADYKEVRIRKQSSDTSSHSRSSTFTDDHDVVSNLNHQMSGNNSGEDSFILNNKGSLQISTKETTDSYDNASALFDDYGSDNDEDDSELEEEHKVHENSVKFSSPGQRSPTHPFTSTNSLSIEQNFESPEKSASQSHIFSEQRSVSVFFERSTSSVPSHGDDLPVTFDNYGPSSESEEEVDKSKFVGRTNAGIGSHKKNMDSYQAENSIFTPQLAEGMEDTEHSNDSSLEESKELNFGNLTGGLRNKGYRHPPYLKIPRGNTFSSGEAANDTDTRIKQSSPPASVEASVSSGSYNQQPYSRKGSDEVNIKLSKRISVTHVDSSDDDSEEEQPKQTFSSIQDQYNKPPSFEENKRSTVRVPLPYFGSGNSDSDEDLPKTSLKAHSNTGFSRRTKASPSNSRRSSNLKNAVSSEPTVVSGYVGEKNSSRSSNADEALPKTQPQKKNSDHSESFQHPSLNSQATPRLVLETKRSSFDGTLKSSEKEETSTSVPKIISSSSGNNLKAQTSFGEGSSKENASHVHPKLPDYDALTAHINSLRQNRQ
ncbi:hypothetical protein REPUB_Repub03eG0070400 [Reevesia pubescens]